MEVDVEELGACDVKEVWNVGKMYKSHSILGLFLFGGFYVFGKILGSNECLLV